MGGLAAAKQTRILKARGIFSTQNGIKWRVSPNGVVQGLLPDGNKIRDRINVTEDDEIHIGPFRLGEAKTCSCIHWLRRDDPEKSLVWSRDQSLQTKVRLGTAF